MTTKTIKKPIKTIKSKEVKEKKRMDDIPLPPFYGISRLIQPNFKEENNKTIAYMPTSGGRISTLGLEGFIIKPLKDNKTYFTQIPQLIVFSRYTDEEYDENRRLEKEWKKNNLYMRTVNSYCIKAPTGNCQWGVLYAANSILSLTKPWTDHYQNPHLWYAFIEKYLYFYFKKLSKKMMMFDVHRYHDKTLKKIFKKEDFQMKSNYISTNGSKMCIYLIKTNNFIEEYEKKNAKKPDATSWV